jgi:hypothetical protein
MSNNSIQYIKNILTFLHSHPTIESFVKNFENNETGFMFSDDPQLKLIMDAVEEDGHTGASFACTLRACQSILLGIRTIDEYIKMEAESNENWRKICEEQKQQAEQEQAEQEQAEQEQAEQEKEQEQEQEQAEQEQEQKENKYYS